MIRQRYNECALATLCVARGLDQEAYEAVSDDYTRRIGHSWADCTVRGCVTLHWPELGWELPPAYVGQWSPGGRPLPHGTPLVIRIYTSEWHCVWAHAVTLGTDGRIIDTGDASEHENLTAYLGHSINLCAKQGVTPCILQLNEHVVWTARVDGRYR